MKKIACILICLCLLALTSCVPKQENDGIEGVKQNITDGILALDLENVRFSQGEIVATQAWSDEMERREGCFARFYTQELRQYSGPQVFAVAQDKTIYVYDTYNKLIKAFKDKKQVSQIDLKNTSFEAGVMQDMIWANNALYAVEKTQAVVVKITDNTIETVEFDEPINEIISVAVNPNGEVEAKALFSERKQATFYLKADTEKGKEIFSRDRNEIIEEKQTENRFALTKDAYEPKFVLERYDSNSELTNSLVLDFSATVLANGMPLAEIIGVDDENVYIKAEIYGTFIVKVNFSKNFAEAFRIPDKLFHKDDEYGRWYNGSTIMMMQIAQNGYCYRGYMDAEGTHIVCYKLN
ncbi:MAG: hypothetical protein E7491_04385 [Ruminococcaceae bacterium]|nr:hypothetical protein [Oscillospiraceae bacterium]